MLDFCLPEIFGSFLHQQVEVTRNADMVFVRGQNVETYSVLPSDKTMTELRNATAQMKMELEVCFPAAGTLICSDGGELPFGLRSDRLSVTVDRAGDGIWKIAQMNIG